MEAGENTVDSSRVARLLTLGANLAVLLGLVFVGLEVRNSRAAAEAESLDGVYGGFLEWNLAIVGDTSLVRIWAEGQSQPERLTDLEARQFATLMRSLLNQMTRVYGLYRAGLMNEATWELYARQVVTLSSTEGGKLYFAGNELPADFLAALNRYSTQPARMDGTLGRTPLR